MFTMGEMRNRQHGRAGRPLAPHLGVQPAAIPKAARRGVATAARWRRLLDHL